MAADAFLVKPDFRFLDLDLEFRFAILGTKFSKRDSTLVNTDTNFDTVKWQSRMGIRRKKKKGRKKMTNRSKKQIDQQSKILRL